MSDVVHTVIDSVKKTAVRSWYWFCEGTWRTAWEELVDGVRATIWWRYRGVCAIEVWYPSRRGDPAKTLTVEVSDEDEILYIVRHYLRPGRPERVYIRYNSGRRRRIRLR